MAVVISLGSNISDGNASKILRLRKGLADFPQSSLKLTKVSRVWSSPSWPLGSGPDFVNAVVCVETTLEPFDILHALLDIERRHGRIRSVPNAPRTLDLDLIDVDGQVFERAELVLPHPRMHQRQFVLGPLQDVLPDWVHPVSGLTVSELLATCDPAQAAHPSHAAAELWPEIACL